MAEGNQGQVNELQIKLGKLDQRALDEVAYVLSLYESPFAETRPDVMPMHFLGRFLGIEQHADGITEMKLGSQNENTYGVAQGGAIYTLADVAIGFGILKTLAEGEKVFTLELKVNFIEKGQGVSLLATPIILRRGRNTVAAECAVTDEKGTLVAKALGTFYISGRK